MLKDIDSDTLTREVEKEDNLGYDQVKSKLLSRKNRTMDAFSICQLAKEALESETQAEILYYSLENEVKRNLPNYYPESHYNEALPKIIEGVKRNIQRFPTVYKIDVNNLDSSDQEQTQLLEKKLINFFTTIAKRKCIDVYRPHKKDPKNISSDQPVNDDDENYTVGETIAENKPTGLDKILQDQLIKIGAKLEQYILTDPNDELKNQKIGKLPKETDYQELLKLFFLDGLTVAQISRKLDISNQTLYSQLKIDLKRNNCLRFIQQKAIELGYIKE
jgi:DNA-directed RNA polymerase specialized sigma24 family protein